MTECEKYQELCAAFVDDELTAEELASLQAHLAVCPSCAEYLDDLRQVVGLCREKPPEPPEAFHENIMQYIVAQAQATVVQPEHRRRTLPVFTVLAAAAVVVLCVLSGVSSDFINLQTGTTSGAASSGAADSGVAAEGIAPRTAQIEPQADIAAAPQGAQAQLYAASESSEEEESMLTLVRSLPITPESIANNNYAFCYISTGEEEIPEFEGVLVAENDTASYFTVRNNMGVLEKVLSTLSEGGYEVEVRQDVVGVTIDSNAAEGLMIIIQEK